MLAMGLVLFLVTLRFFEPDFFLLATFGLALAGDFLLMRFALALVVFFLLRVAIVYFPENLVCCAAKAAFYKKLSSFIG